MNFPKANSRVEIRHSSGWLSAVLLLVSATVAGVQLSAAEPKEFRAGAATSNITPWLGVSINGGMRDRVARHVHDELHARAIVLDDGRARLAIVVCDSCMIPREICDAAKAMIREQVELPPERVLISATHTHSAPAAAPVFQSDPDPRYRMFLAQRIADAVQRAANNLRPARIGWASGSVPGQVFNRRWHMKPGTLPEGPFADSQDRVKMNPPAGSDNLIEPAGPTDPEVWVVSVQTRAGEPLALLANYSLHYVGGTGPGEVSADYFGVFADRMQHLLGADRRDPPFVGILSNGTSGDINNINFRQPRPRHAPYEQMRTVADDVAQEAYRVSQAIEHRDRVSLDGQTAELELGVRLPSEADLKRAKKIIAGADGPEMKTLAEVYAREAVLLAEYPERVKLVVQALRIGDLAITAIPCETFVEIGLGLKEQSPIKPTFTISLANGYNGYLPTPKQHDLGGYETWRARSSYLEEQASEKIEEALLGLLREMNGKVE